MASIEELLKRDELREKDGFPKRIKYRSVLAGPGRIISVPYVEQEKLIHGEFEPEPDDESGDLDEGTGSGEGKVGDVVGQAPIQGEGEGDGQKPQAGKGAGSHGFEQEAYQRGKELSEKFKLPQLRDKGKKVPTDEYTYDLTDRYRGAGQILDEEETLRSIIETNIMLGRLGKKKIDTTKLVVGPDDEVYRVLSKEKIWKSQAVVFFARDYSGSMGGKPTEAIISQHLTIYAWLLHQYEKLVIPRFFVHDMEAREVSDQEYFTLMAGGGTFIPSVYREVTKTIEGESLARYNIYVFQGTDGDDFDDGTQAIPEIKKILSYVNRVGVSVFKYGDRETPFEAYIKKGGFLQRKNVFRMHVVSLAGEITEENNIEAIKALIAQD